MKVLFCIFISIFLFIIETEAKVGDIFSITHKEAVVKIYQGTDKEKKTDISDNAKNSEWIREKVYFMTDKPLNNLISLKINLVEHQFSRLFIHYEIESCTKAKLAVPPFAVIDYDPNLVKGLYFLNDAVPKWQIWKRFPSQAKNNDKENIKKVFILNIDSKACN